MLTLSDQALAYVQGKNQPIYLEMSPTIKECCFTLRESPAVHVGEPRDKAAYHAKTVAGVTVYAPRDLPEIPLTINIRNLFGYKSLYVIGWKLA